MSHLCCPNTVQSLSATMCVCNLNMIYDQRMSAFISKRKQLANYFYNKFQTKLNLVYLHQKELHRVTFIKAIMNTVLLIDEYHHCSDLANELHHMSSGQVPVQINYRAAAFWRFKYIYFRQDHKKLSPLPNYLTGLNEL